MWNAIIIVIVSLLPLIVTLITSPQDIFISDTTKSQKTIFKKSNPKNLSLRGWAFASSIIITALFAFLQHKQIENEKRVADFEIQKRDTLAKNEQDRRDSISYKKIESSKNQTIEALARYGYRLDSANKDLIRIVKDSLGKKVTIIQGENPVLSFCKKGIELDFKRNDSIGFIVNLCSQNAGAILKNAPIYVAGSVESNDDPAKKLLYIGKKIFLSRNSGIEKGGGQGQEFYIGTKVDISTIYVLAVAEYTNTYGKGLIKFKQAGFLDIRTNKFYINSATFDEEIYNFFQSNGVTF